MNQGGQDEDGWLSVQTEDDQNRCAPDLGFMDDASNFKAVAHVTDVNSSLMPKPVDLGKNPTQNLEGYEVQFESMQPEDYSLLHVKSMHEPGTLWDALTQFFEETENLDPEVNDQAKVVTGHYYNTPQDCKFMTGVYRVNEKDTEEKSIVDFRRLSGDAFLMNDFFHLVVEWLTNKELVEPEEDSEDEFTDEPFTDDEDLLSEVEDMDGAFNVAPMNPHKNYLQFDYDEGLLNMWIERYQESHMEDKDYVMKMMSFNAELESNRDFMLQRSAETLKELIETQLKETKEWNSAPITRNTCLLLKNLSQSDAAMVDAETIKAVCEAMATWCPGQNASPVIGEVRESRQSMLEMAEFLTNMVENQKLDQDFISNVMKESLNTNQMDKIVNFTANREEAVFKSFGEVVENLTTPTN